MTELTWAHRAGNYLEVAPGIEIYYEDVGDGKPLVLVPGWTFTTKVFDRQFAAFEQDYRVVSFDPRSQGRSTVTMEGNNYATQGDDLAKLIDHLELENPILLGWSTGSNATWSLVRSRGTNNLRAHVSVDMPPIGTSCDENLWMEGALPDLAGFYQAIQTPVGLRGMVTWYAENVMLEQDLTPELVSWILEQSLSTPPLIAGALIADATFSNYSEEAKQVDKDIPSLFVVANHWAEAAKSYLEDNCPNSQVEVLGEHMMFWEYHEEFNTLLSAFLANLD